MYIGPPQAEQSAAVVISVKVDLAELMGSEIYVYGSFQGGSLIAKVLPQKLPKDGETLALTMDCTKMHIFDKDTGAVIK